MDIEELIKEEERIQKMLRATVPGSQEYQNLKQDLVDIQKLRLEAQKVDDQKIDQNWRREIEENKVIAEEKANRLKSADTKRHDILDVVKVGIAVLGSLAGIILTGNLEETHILSQKAFSWIQKPKY